MKAYVLIKIRTGELQEVVRQLRKQECATPVLLLERPDTPVKVGQRGPEFRVRSGFLSSEPDVFGRRRIERSGRRAPASRCDGETSKDNRESQGV